MSIVHEYADDNWLCKMLNFTVYLYCYNECCGLREQGKCFTSSYIVVTTVDVKGSSSVKLKLISKIELLHKT